MVACAVVGCRNSSKKTNKSCYITFHAFPTDLYLCAIWTKKLRSNRNDLLWKPTKYTRICSEHFEEETIYTSKSGLRKLRRGTVPTRINKEEMLVQAARSEPQPGPSRFPCTQTSDNSAFSTTHQDPLSKARIEQCRFCGEFGKTCVQISKMPYLSNNKTTLAVNDNIVQLDFVDDSLPQTVCKECDNKLKEMYNFVQKVKAAQNNIIKVGADIIENVENDYTELETVVVKTEYDSDENSDENEDKSGILDSITVGETVFIKESVPQKRKGNAEKVTAKKPKKAKDAQKKSENENTALIIDVKEEVIEREETNEDVNNTGCSISGIETDVKADEVEIATSALIYEMRRESNDDVS